MLIRFDRAPRSPRWLAPPNLARLLRLAHLDHVGRVARGALGSGAIFGALTLGAVPERNLLPNEVAAAIHSLRG